MIIQMKHASLVRKLGWLAAAALLALTALAPAGVSAAGAIWTTHQGCVVPDVPQNENPYVTGETVTIRGENFAASTQYPWTITGQPGNASSDPGIVVASGNVTTDGTGYFCVDAYVIPVGDDGVYSVDAGGKNDNYHVTAVTPTPTPTPTPQASVGGVTDAPSLPPTDKISGTSGTSGTSDSLGLVLMALAGVLASIMVLTPARARRR